MNNKGIINGKIFDIVEPNNYNPSVNDAKTTAIQKGDILYPIRTENDTEPGLYEIPGSPISIFEEPSEQEIEQYRINDENVIDFNNIQNMSEYIDAQMSLRNMERTILCTPENIFSPPIKDDDKPAMRGLKEAVIKKRIDIDKYGPRFGANFANDKRLFKGNDITLSKLMAIGENLDMKCTLIIEDASPDVPNPIGEQIIVNLMSKEGEDIE